MNWINSIKKRSPIKKRNSLGESNSISKRNSISEFNSMLESNSISKRNYSVLKTNSISRTNPSQICKKWMALMGFRTNGLPYFWHSNHYLNKHKIQWDDKYIPYSEISFIIVSFKTLDCNHGTNKNISKKRKWKEQSVKEKVWAVTKIFNNFDFQASQVKCYLPSTAKGSFWTKFGNERANL